jgi:transcriptional regulator with XRE-family HTH domain
MIRDPKSWRTEAGMSLAAVAAGCGIGGKNPSKTYSRYETGESPAPADVVEAVRKISRGKITVESFHAARLAHLRKETA